jgi:hypothetical protein
MASIGPITLDPITVVVANATVNVHVPVTFSSYDVNSNQPYKMVCKLVGDDTAEGNADDPIVNGNLTPVINLPGIPPIELGQVIQADGLTTKTFTFTKTLAKANLDEDKAPEPNPDEIQAEVTLTPILPAKVTRQSNVQTLVA